MGACLTKVAIEPQQVTKHRNPPLRKTIRTTIKPK
jgi:hypothetical protein